MIARETRPLSNEEAAFLRSELELAKPHFSWPWTIVFCFAASVLLCLAGCIALKRLFDISFNMELYLIGTVILTLIAAWSVRKFMLNNQVADLEKTMSKLISSPMEVTTCTATAAISVEEIDDEGAGYFVDVGGGQLLFLHGQYLYEFEGDHPRHEKFPCTEFKILSPSPSTPFAAFWLQVLGVELPIIRTIQFTDEFYVPDDRDILTASLQNLEADLLDLAKKHGK